MKQKKQHNAVNIQEDEDFSVYPLYRDRHEEENTIKKNKETGKTRFLHQSAPKKEAGGKYC